MQFRIPLSKRVVDNRIGTRYCDSSFSRAALLKLKCRTDPDSDSDPQSAYMCQSFVSFLPVLDGGCKVLTCIDLRDITICCAQRLFMCRETQIGGQSSTNWSVRCLGLLRLITFWCQHLVSWLYLLLQITGQVLCLIQLEMEGPKSNFHQLSKSF